MAALKFFSPEWCERNIEVSNASEAIYKGFKHAPSFTNILVFEVSDKNVVVTVEYVAGLIKSWSASDSPDSVVFSRFAADLATWRSAAERAAEGAKLLMAGKIQLKHGPLQAAIENAGAFNSFLASWGDAETDWAI